MDKHQTACFGASLRAGLPLAGFHLGRRGADGDEEADKQLTREWAKRFTLPLGRYEYYGLGAFTPRFYPHTMDKQIKFDHALGVESQQMEVYTFLPHTAPMIWAFAKLQWNIHRDIDERLDEFYTKMYGDAAPTMAQYYELLERTWNTPRPGRSRDMLAVSRSYPDQILAISPDEISQGLALLEQVMGKLDDAKVRQRIDIVCDALVFSQVGIESTLLNQQLRTGQIISADDAEHLMDDLQRYARMATERERVWAEARLRDDLLGKTVRGLGDMKHYLVIDEFPQMDTHVVGVALDLLDWYRAHDPARAATARAKLLAISWPPAVNGVIRAVVTAHDNDNLLVNTDLETTGASGADDAKDGWIVCGAPDHWSIWIRSEPSNVPPSVVTIQTDVGRRGSRGLVYEAGQGGAMIQSIPTKPSESYVATVWLRGDVPAVTAANLYVAFRDKKGNQFGPDRRQCANTVFGVATDQWQRLVMHVTVPPRAVSLVLMLAAHPFEQEGQRVIFDDATLQRVTEN